MLLSSYMRKASEITVCAAPSNLCLEEKHRCFLPAKHTLLNKSEKFWEEPAVTPVEGWETGGVSPCATHCPS